MKPNGLAIFTSLVFFAGVLPVASAQQRSLGLDISAWQGNWTSTMWNTVKRSPTLRVNGVAGDGRDFVYLRSSRGGTTGFYNQSDPNNNNGLNTLSQRYNDQYFAQNITRATSAGLFAGSYHFSRPDIVTNTGADEADHFMQMAGAWMRPGYLMPVHDLETGDTVRTDDQMAQFTMDFSNRVFAVMGIRPAIYLNGNYANNVIGGASSTLRTQVVSTHPQLWIARWPNEANPAAIDVQNTNPNASLSSLYGPWDDNGNTQPWSFWQYTASGRLNAFPGDLDLNVANGGIEFVKDQLVPAVLIVDANAAWTSLSTWNSGRTPVAPVQGVGQVPRVGTLTLPTVRLPASNDTVILERAAANPTITLSSGAHNIRKLYARETLHIEGGSLNINYIPSPDSSPISAQFSTDVTLGSTASPGAAASLSVHTLQIDATRTFTLAGGSLSFNKILLSPSATQPAKITLAGNIQITPLSGAASTISPANGTGLSGFVDLGGQQRTLTLLDGAAVIDLSIDLPVRNGGLTKSGPGTLRLNAANSFAGPTTLNQGTVNLKMSALAHQTVLGGGGFTPGGADLRDGRLVFDYAGAASHASQVNAILGAGRPSGFSTGLLFSTALIDANTGIGWIDDGLSSLIVARTLYGDADLDLAVGFTDLVLLARTFNRPGVWALGDFDYDGNVNFSDLVLLARNYNKTLLAGGGGSGNIPFSPTGTFEGDWNLALQQVPEPTVLSVLILAGATALTRRKRPAKRPA